MQKGHKAHDFASNGITNSMEQRPVEKLTVAQLVKIFPAFYGNRRFITVFTTARQFRGPV
jgi:hypothetical protein